jgi:hypothetical protein
MPQLSQKGIVELSKRGTSESTMLPSMTTNPATVFAAVSIQYGRTEVKSQIKQITGCIERVYVFCPPRTILLEKT